MIILITKLQQKSFPFQRSYFTVTSTEHCTDQRYKIFYLKSLFSVNHYTERNVNALLSGNKVTFRYRHEGKTIMWRKDCPICSYHLLISLHLHWKHLAQDHHDLLRTISTSKQRICLSFYSPFMMSFSLFYPQIRSLCNGMYENNSCLLPYSVLAE